MRQRELHIKLKTDRPFRRDHRRDFLLKRVQALTLTGLRRA
jgi:hypothetical protein